MKVAAKKHIFAFSLKSAIALLLVWAIYRQVFSRANLEMEWQAFLEHFHWPNSGWLLAVVLLAPLNQALEALKWGQLIRNFSQIRFFEMLKAVFAGTTIAIFTPNRVGEYGGRVLFVEEGNGWKAVVATMVGSLSQLLVLLSVGLVGALYFSMRFLQPETYLAAVFFTLGLSFIGLLFFTYFNIDLVAPLAKRIPYIDKVKKYVRHLAVLRHYHRKELAMALWYALLRYLTYSTQYYLLLQFYGVPAPWLAGMAGIATIFLVQASVPLPPVVGLLARGEIALYVWGFFGGKEADILAATFSLFVINIVAPALLGLFCIIQVNILKSLGYEKDKTS